MPNRPSDGTRINDEIRIPQVRVIGADGAQLGLLETRTAVQMAKSAGLDLVEVSPTAKPPVCRIMDYGKFRFEQAKKTKASKAKQHTVKLKEIKLHPKTALNDYQYRMKQARAFLEDGIKVKLIMQFRGREMAHQEYGRRLVDQAKIDLADVGDLEMDARMEGNSMTSIYNPKKQQQVAAPKKVAPAVAKPATEPMAAGEASETTIL